MRQSHVVLTSFVTLVSLAACGADRMTGVPNFDGPCRPAALAIGQTAKGTLSSTACSAQLDRDFSWFYDPFRVQLDSAQSYVFYLRGDTLPTGINMDDPALSLDLLTGNTAAESDDDGGNRNSQLAFVAPAGGTFALHVHSYAVSDSGSYVLVPRSCGRAPTLADTLIRGTLTTANCVLHGFNSITDSSLVSFYQLRMRAGQSVVVRAISSAFHPHVYIGGPDFDAQCHFNDCSSTNRTATGDTLRLAFTAFTSGQYTVILGTNAAVNPYPAAGSYSIDIDR